MAFENLSEQIKESLQSLKSRVTESETFNRFQESYNNLPSRQQKLILVMSGIVAFTLLINIPIQTFLTSNESLVTYKNQKQIVQKLHQAVRLNSQSDFQPQKYSLMQLQGDLTNRMKTAQVSDTQIKMSSTTPDITGIPKKVQTAGYILELTNLNVRQISKVANMLENFSDSVLVTGFKSTASEQDPHYFNTEFTLLNFSIETDDAPPGLNAPFRGR